ncbi:hypothetical protein PVL29_013869 [Vitis rotundifolia]|uniref:RBR-type E3 ubiquitin transferase n=1 Tax=Vitis rotundifolia TaxID=103349 RepID=A0AA38ZF06_VITRO|nr:hypothetical protein PVL29_013869 [Vitis rotundifolia]
MEAMKLERPVVEIVDIEEEDAEEQVSLFLTPISCRGSTRNTAISVEQYSADKELYLSIKASLLQPHTPLIHLDNDDDDDDLQILGINPTTTPPAFSTRKPFTFPSVTETGQPSNSKPDPPPTFVCEICVDPKPLNHSFSIKGCPHSYCSDCMTKYVASKLQDNVSRISCPAPNCTGVLEPQQCRPILPSHVFDRWGNALCEALILGSQKFYCPYKDCSALLIRDEGEVIKESECPNCRRLFCAQCEVPWHSGIDCGEFQKLNKDERGREDILMMNLAKTNNWKRCPKCKFYVEKSFGCMYIRCRCGFAFCYNCGAPSATLSHICPQCRH